MKSPQGDLLPLRKLPIEYGLSDSTWRRAIRDFRDPLPHVRVGLGSPRHSRILIRRSDIEAWISRRNAEAQSRSVVDEIVGKVIGRE